MREQFLDCLKRERDIRIKPKLCGGKTAFRKNPTLRTSSQEIQDVTDIQLKDIEFNTSAIINENSNFMTL